MKVRMYDPEIGRFHSVDPETSSADSLSLNPYIYCGNNPIDRIDPSGKGFWSSLKKYAAVAVKVANQIWAPIAKSVISLGKKNIPVISAIARWTQGNPIKTYIAYVGANLVAAGIIIGAIYAPQIIYSAATLAARNYDKIVNAGKSIQQLLTGTIGKTPLASASIASRVSLFCLLVQSGGGRNLIIYLYLVRLVYKCRYILFPLINHYF